MPVKKSKILTCFSTDLNRWDVLKFFGEETKCKVKAFCVFRAGSGAGAVVITMDDNVFGVCTDHCDPSLFGMAADVPYNYPFRISCLCNKNLTDISVGVLVGAALDSSGGLYWWGKTLADAGEPQLPIRPKTPNPSPMFVKVCCGHGFMAALSAHGRVYIWGKLIYSNFACEELVLSSPVKAISCGAVHVAMLCQDASVFTWGSGLDGQRGYHFSAERDTYLIKKLELGEPCQSLACGPVSTVMLTSSGSVYACGDNSESMGFLGVSSQSTKIFKPELVELAGKAVGLAAAWPSPHPYVRYAAITSDNKLFTWGTSRPLLSNNECTGSHLLLSAFYNTSTPRHTNVRVDFGAPLERSISKQSIRSAHQPEPIEEIKDDVPEPDAQLLSSSIEVLSISSSDSSIRPDLLNHRGIENENISLTTFTNSAAGSMVEFAAKLYGSSILSDITFLLRDSNFPGHRLYLCLRSKKFQEFIDMEVSARNDPVMDARSYDPDAFRGLIQFLYMGYHSITELTKLIELHALAVGFDEPDLADQTAIDVLDLLEPGNIVNVITRARQIPSPLLMTKCESYIAVLNVAQPSAMAKLIVDLTRGYS